MIYRLDITRRLHERFLEIVRTALPLITASMADADLAGLAHLRGEMIETIERYRGHVRQLHDDAAREGDTRALAQAAALVRGCASLIEAYDQFRARWADRQALDNWHEYRLSAIVMMKQVRNHVQDAERQRAEHPVLAA